MHPPQPFAADGPRPAQSVPDPAQRDPGLPDLSGSVALVTGGGGGIGAGIAERFAATGAAVVVGYHGSAHQAGEVVDRIVGMAGKPLSCHEASG